MPFCQSLKNNDSDLISWLIAYGLEVNYGQVKTDWKTNDTSRRLETINGKNKFLFQISRWHLITGTVNIFFNFTKKTPHNNSTSGLKWPTITSNNAIFHWMIRKHIFLHHCHLLSYYFWSDCNFTEKIKFFITCISKINYIELL